MRLDMRQLFAFLSDRRGPESMDRFDFNIQEDQ